MRYFEQFSLHRADMKAHHVSLYHRLLETKCIKDFMWAYNIVSEYSGGLGSVEVDLSQDVVCWRSHVPLAREVILQNFEQFSLHRAGMKAHHILVSKGRHNFFLSFFLSFFLCWRKRKCG